MTKYIFVCGGVISGVGKGVATASIARILKERGLSVTIIKIDPYINCDAGTMRPTEHGEVWVTDDGGETDQDLGTYERFLDKPLSKFNNITTGQVYKSLIDRERKGEFLGKTVQFIPHVPNEIKNRIKRISEGYDIVIIEIGGTVGDYENLPFLFAAKSLENEIGMDNICHILVTYLPIPSHIEEMKTKPTQTSIKLLRETGIQPDFILCRGRRELDEVRKKKIGWYSNVNFDNIISMPHVTGPGTVNTIYIIPLDLEKQNLAEKILENLKIDKRPKPDFFEWSECVNNLIKPTNKVNIAMVGKYIDIGDYQLADSYVSVNEALKHAGARNNAGVNITWIDSKDFEKDLSNLEKLRNYDGIIVPGGFGTSGVEGKINAIRFARINDIPFLGLCLGLQLAVIEYARNMCGLKNATSSEFSDNHNENNVIDILPEQKEVKYKGGTMRLGSYKAIIRSETIVHYLYEKLVVYERHRHRYEVNPEYHDILTKNGLVFSGVSPCGRLVEFIEIPEHKFFVATQAHPEFKSSLLKPAPLFNGFIKACLG